MDICIVIAHYDNRKHRSTFVLGDGLQILIMTLVNRTTKRNGGLVDICDNYLYVQGGLFGNLRRIKVCLVV